MSQNKLEKVSDYIDSPENLPINYDLYFPKEKSDTLPVVLFLHGFKGFKNWGPFPQVCRAIAAEGYAVLAFNLSKNGVSGHGNQFDELELFADETLSRDLDDVGMVLKALNDGTIYTGGAALDKNRIGILGHSRGGHTAIAATAEFNSISCLVTWSAVANYNERWSREMVDDWKNKGYTEIENARTGQVMRINKVVYEDAREHEDRLMAIKRIKAIEHPTLIIHGRDDEAVPVEDAKKLFEAAIADKKNCIIIPDTGHTFAGAHPFEADKFPQALEKALTYTRQWFDVYLK